MVLAVAMALASVFGVAAIAKLTDLDGLRRAVVGFGLPTVAAAPLARLLVMGEFVIALALVIRPWARGGALGALALLLVFSGVIALNVSRGRAPACHCFGGLRAAPVGWSTVARNGLLATLAGFVAAGGHLPWLFAGLALVASALWAGLAAGRGGTVRAGMLAPRFSLPDETGRTWTLEDLLLGGRPLLLVFGDHACGACAALLPQVARWQQIHDERVTIAVVSGGARPAQPVAAGGVGPRRLLADADRRVLAAYGVTATPSAVLVDTERIVAAAPAVGAAEIGDLVSKALQPRGRSTIARRAVLFASAALVPAVTAACAAGRGIRLITPSKEPRKEVRAGDGWLCDQRYAVCTSAACEPSPKDPGIVICRCAVQNGYSFGFTSCAERAPTHDRLVSTFSMQNTTIFTRAMTCPTRARWANCLDVVCRIDPHNRRRALCRCKSVESENFLTFGGGCDTRTCTTVIWSAATQQLPGVAEYKSGMKSLGYPVAFPDACPSRSPRVTPPEHRIESAT
ncbi:MauE/DoxX family redox-associated membrane protein [Streptomyces yaanensis]|uniref:MauE/DoxX family redox-associated membrane protein n=1 Tax=Streptomyces yaanensis TaxID=1142239 RepID=A0ABV7SAK2_9ACTN|nr:MauE/DoxX family redox-associated membrane protein [Streptomyces sp. CGMCC 4.7035]WNC02963.1 MauE/DoxX family redox-associated membrane protein [Streptomyces sp. CGMCC 4.7035]